MISSATFSECKRYRYSLRRVWDTSLPRCAFIMLNPSTADERKDDPTIRRVVDFAKSFGCGGVDVYNLFAFRSTDPTALLDLDDPVGPKNDEALSGISAAVVVCAWGFRGSYRGRNREAFGILRSKGIKPLYLDLTAEGHPRHPLYLKADLRPKEFPA